MAGTAWILRLSVAVAVPLLVCSQPAGAAPPECGSLPEDADAPVQAAVETANSAVELNLGRGESGSRRRELEFVFSGDCVPPPDVPVSAGVFAGGESDLPSEAVDVSEPEIDGSTVRVTLTVDRSATDPGGYAGTVRVGNAQMGSGRTDVEIKHQAQLFPGPIILGILSAVGGIALAAIRTGPPATPQGTGLLSRAPAVIGFVFSRNAWAVVLGLGAAATAFNISYISDPTWSMTLPSGFTLIAGVGGAALAASWAAWQAPQGSKDG